jgi:DNA-binding transcriptional MerR regulator
MRAAICDGSGKNQDKPLRSASGADAEAQPGADQLYGIAELASEFEITARAIRFYEAKELLSPPRVSGSRVYTRRERARLKLILRAKSIGFSLAEIKQFLGLYGDRGEGRPQQAAYLAERSAALIEELKRKQVALTATLKELKVIHKQCLRYLTEGGSCEAIGASETKAKKQPKR